MDVSLNIILDSISHYRYEAYVDLPSVTTFRRVSILLRDVKDTKRDCLYVCRLSDALKAAEQKPGLFYICLRDRIHDEREKKEYLAGMIIINENLELDQIFSEIQDTFVLVNDWYQNMQDAIIRQKTMQDIITMSEPVIGNFITVTDTAFSLLAFTKNLQTDDPMQSALVQNGYHTEEFIKVFKKLKRFDVWMNADDLVINTEGNVCKYDIISKVFVFNETYFTHVVMICDHRRLSAGLIDLYRHLIDMLSFYIKRNSEEVKNFDHVYSSLVTDLMQHKISDKDAVQERAKFIGIRPHDQFIVMLLSGGSGSDSVFPGLVALDISKMFSRIRPIHFNYRLMLFLHHPDIASYIEEQDMYSKLNAYFAKYGIYCGVSDIFSDLPDISQAYHQAELALDKSDYFYQKGRVFWADTPYWSNIALFETYYSSCLFDRSEEALKLWKGSKYGKMLLELYRSDKEKNTNNLEILYTFLMNERRTTETASTLHMHRNNVVYRISRIQEFLKVNLDDRLTRLNLSMTFQMLKYSGSIDDYSFPGSADTVTEI
jgi:sugar diacid utilization regulator